MLAFVHKSHYLQQLVFQPLAPYHSQRKCPNSVIRNASCAIGGRRDSASDMADASGALDSLACQLRFCVCACRCSGRLGSARASAMFAGSTSVIDLTKRSAAIRAADERLADDAAHVTFLYAALFPMPCDSRLQISFEYPAVAPRLCIRRAPRGLGPPPPIALYCRLAHMPSSEA